jgi:hypothetical protein
MIALTAVEMTLENTRSLIEARPKAASLRSMPEARKEFDHDH